MPTRAGLSLGAAAIGVLTAGRVFGFIELYLIGAVLIVLLAGASTTVTFTPLRLEVGRTVRPARVHVGEPSQVVLTLRNDARRRTPVLGLHDRVGDTRGATLLAAPLERGARSSAAYSLPTTRRGILHVGPLSVELTDPFGLARARVTAVTPTTVTVYPQVVELPSAPRTDGADRHGVRARGVHHDGDEFHSLRPYVLGDDLRQVHWPATARRDELVVRQLDLHRHGRTTVILETRPSLHVDSSFETAVVAAASVLVAAHHRGDELRMLTAGGLDSGIGEGDVHLDLLLSQLATVQATTGIENTPSALEHHGSSVRVTSDLDPMVVARPGVQARDITIAVITDGTAGRREPGIIRIARPADLADLWSTAPRPRRAPA